MNPKALTAVCHTAPRVTIAGELVALQRPTPRKLLVSADVYCQRCLKHPFLSIFHSYEQLLHAALLEGERAVSHFVPRPFLLRVRKHYYTPACFVVRGGLREVIELKPRGELAAELAEPLAAFFALQGMSFVVCAHEAIRAREQEALNWLNIIRTLVAAGPEATTAAEAAIVDEVSARQPVAIGALLSDFDPTLRRAREIAVLRLLHRGLLAVDLTLQPFSYDMELGLCG